MQPQLQELRHGAQRSKRPQGGNPPCSRSYQIIESGREAFEAVDIRLGPHCLIPLRFPVQSRRHCAGSIRAHRGTALASRGHADSASTRKNLCCLLGKDAASAADHASRAAVQVITTRKLSLTQNWPEGQSSTVLTNLDQTFSACSNHSTRTPLHAPEATQRWGALPADGLGCLCSLWAWLRGRQRATGSVGRYQQAPVLKHLHRKVSRRTEQLRNALVRTKRHRRVDPSRATTEPERIWRGRLRKRPPSRPDECGNASCLEVWRCGLEHDQKSVSRLRRATNASTESKRRSASESCGEGHVPSSSRPEIFAAPHARHRRQPPLQCTCKS
jgi:hypothetical protein